MKEGSTGEKGGAEPYGNRAYGIQIPSRESFDRRHGMCISHGRPLKNAFMGPRRPNIWSYSRYDMKARKKATHHFFQLDLCTTTRPQLLKDPLK